MLIINCILVLLIEYIFYTLILLFIYDTTLWAIAMLQGCRGYR